MKFFKTLIAATLGTILAFLIIFFLAIITISSSSKEPEPYVQSNSVLKISLSGSLPSRPPSNPLDELFNRKQNDKASLQTLKENLSKAKTDTKISGIWLQIDVMTAGWANLEEAHQLISAFRDSSDKFVYASTNDIGFNEKGYYLATAADSIFSPPEAFFEFDGFYSQVMFLEGMFDKLGINAEVTRHGKYKGAVEPFYRKDLSEENAYQLNQILEGVTNTFLTAVNKKTGLSIEKLNGLLNDKPHLTAEFAYRQHLIDSLMYDDQVENYIKTHIGISDSGTLTTVSNGRYAKVSASTAGLSQPSVTDKIAVIYANGPIAPDMDSNSPFDRDNYISASFIENQLKQIRGDNNVKALVLRVKSPGGSGSTSDTIWRMLQETKKTIPVIVSMGHVAASGGYYISMAADSIVAEPTTITGSIGVFATKFNAKQLFNDKLGITFDEVKSHEHADWLTSTRQLSPSEQKALQQYIDAFYHTFITKAAKDRGMTADQIDNIAQGRVWTGAAAQKQGLVDELGGLDRALDIAAEKAGLKAYKVARYPKPKSFYEMLMGSASVEAQTLFPNSWFSNPIAEKVKTQLSLLKHHDALTLFPYEIKIE
ncbi:MAG: signal peptide peptidase SppA [Balneolaceae bacterium]|jgi:protease-4